MKKIITFLYLLILAYACYDDKGNYDYREINQISIQNIDSLVLCDQMDLLSIPVTLEGTQYSDSNRFTYMWEVNQKVVATTIDLNVYANFPLGINTARFVVTDKELGTKALIVTDRVMAELGNPATGGATNVAAFDQSGSRLWSVTLNSNWLIVQIGGESERHILEIDETGGVPIQNIAG